MKITKVLGALCLFALTAFAQKEAPGCEHSIIHGATYGVNDITNKVAHEYNSGTKAFEASSQKWGASTLNEGSKHTLTIVYERCGNIALQAVEEGATITLP